MATYKTEKDLAAELKRQLVERGAQAEWAKRAGVSAVYVSDFVNGRRTAGPAILRALGYEATPYYRKAE